MGIYTIIATWKSQVWVEQIHADMLLNACQIWGKHFSEMFQHPKFDRADFLEDLAFKIAELPPVPLENMQSVWGMSFIVAGKALWLHIVLTDIPVRGE